MEQGGFDDSSTIWDMLEAWDELQEQQASAADPQQGGVTRPDSELLEAFAPIRNRIGRLPGIIRLIRGIPQPERPRNYRGIGNLLIGFDVDEEFGPGTFEALGKSWASALLLRPETRDADLEALAGKLVRRWNLFGPQEAALMDRAERADRTPEEERLYLARVGLVLASGNLESLQ
jgi:hypothetical protein